MLNEEERSVVKYQVEMIETYLGDIERGIDQTAL
jgi:hypothetical protein